MAQSQKQGIRTHNLQTLPKACLLGDCAHSIKSLILRFLSPYLRTDTPSPPPVHGHCTYGPWFLPHPQPQAQVLMRALTLDKALQSWHGNHKPPLQVENYNLHHLLCSNCEMVLTAPHMQGNLRGLRRYCCRPQGSEEVLVATAWAQGVTTKQARHGILKLGIAGWIWRRAGLQSVTCAACANSQPSVTTAKLPEPTCVPLLRAHKDVLRLFRRRQPALLHAPSTPAPSLVSTAGTLLKLLRAAAAASSSPSYSTHAIQAAA